MKTLEEIKRFIVNNDTNYLSANKKDVEKGVYDKAISYLLERISEDEEVQFALTTVGVTNGGRTVAGGRVVLFVTNERIIYGCKDWINAVLKTITFDECNDVESNTFGIFTGKISINTKTEKINFEFDKKHCVRVANAIDKLIRDMIKNKKAPTMVISQQPSAANELLALKQLLDAGIITLEEFEAKKKELLGL